MELLIEKVTNPECITGSVQNSDGPPDIRQWDRLVINERDEVCEINWTCNFSSSDHVELTGSLQLHGVPRTVQTISTYDKDFEGTLDFVALPEGLTRIEFEELVLGNCCVRQVSHIACVF